MLLEKIIAGKKEEVARLKERFSLELIEEAKNAPLTLSLSKALKKNDFSLIAEIKKTSPSAGIIQENFNPEALALTYEFSGSSAISVLTDREFFGGSLEDLSLVKETTKLPVLRKDFIIDEYQVYESRLARADAILLIVRILSDVQLESFLKLAHSLKMECLVEAHNQKELKRALKTGAKLIGINNRDLDDLTVNIEKTEELISQNPEIKGRVIVSESGISTAEDIKLLKKWGANAALVGEAILKSEDAALKIKELLVD